MILYLGKTIYGKDSLPENWDEIQEQAVAYVLVYRSRESAQPHETSFDEIEIVTPPGGAES